MYEINRNSAYLIAAFIGHENEKTPIPHLRALVAYSFCNDVSGVHCTTLVWKVSTTFFRGSPRIDKLEIVVWQWHLPYEWKLG